MEITYFVRIEEAWTFPKIKYKAGFTFKKETCRWKLPTLVERRKSGHSQKQSKIWVTLSTFKGKSGEVNGCVSLYAGFAKQFTI